MRWSARLAATLSALLPLACASSPTEAPRDPTDRRIPDRPSAVEFQVDSPSIRAPFDPIPWFQPRPRLRVDVRAPEPAVRRRARRSASPVRKARRRLQGAWSFVYGRTIGMAIFERTGGLVLQPLDGEKVTLTYRVVRPPGADPGRLQLRPAADSSAPVPGEGAGSEGVRLRYRVLFKWRSSGRVDLQVPAAGEPWPEEFTRHRYRLFRDVREAVRYLHRRERGFSGTARVDRVE